MNVILFHYAQQPPAASDSPAAACSFAWPGPLNDLAWVRGKDGLSSYDAAYAVYASPPYT